MKLKTIQSIKALNSRFYQIVAGEFASSREYFWEGWYELVASSEVFSKPYLNVLDLGCGTARFAQFLAQEVQQIKHNKVAYRGVDFSNELLVRAVQPCSIDSYTLLHSDILNSIPNSKYNLIVLFAVMHHIPSVAAREQLLNRVAHNLAPGGVVCLTTWNFLENERWQSRFIEPVRIGVDPADLDSGDYILDWRRGMHAFRYCHAFTEGEVAALLPNSLRIAHSFTADGKTGEGNTYYIITHQL